MNYYKRHIGDYLRDTAHLSLLEHGVYARLLDVYYTREAPLPATGECCRLIGARSRDERAAVEAVLREFFAPNADASSWTQARCEREIAVAREKAERNREVGKKGGRPRKHGNPQKTQTVSNAKPNDNPQETLATSHYPYSVPSERAGAGAPPGPADVIFATGVPLLTAAGVSDRNARSMLGLMRKQHGDEAVIDALARCAQMQPLEPVAWLQAALKPQPAAAPRRRDDGRTAAAIAVFGHAPDSPEVVDVG